MKGGYRYKGSYTRKKEDLQENNIRNHNDLKDIKDL